ncbi:xyloglucan galactosyltransferase KATAMARI1 homolog [Brachypodium distachyon]|uniref:xyloglucan galactosyltransferase KATAMARI1 homolog n=1 Tax=Brachypodium distachyon TaxID=15368 RepID=UPI0001C75408|nr:xyloglucan galactosyltransferase KATAMARI1 homolog [Brachypodium distachyon]|eukprot:XP_003559614.1 xyloglucan galactosyltransferase KATAMARI1 homolog [Brachypodium distachyon]
MVSLHGSAVVRAGRYVLALVMPACFVIWMVFFFFPFPSPEVDVVRESFQANINSSAGQQRTVDAPPPPARQERAETPSPPPPARQERISQARKPARKTEVDRCAGRYIYIHDLPPRFNSHLIRDCRTLSEWTDMCKHMANAGMGPQLTRTGGVLPAAGWYDTNQFALEVIFHNRMRNQYDCLTTDASRAAAFYVPYYAGLDVGRHLWGVQFNNTVRDALADDLVRWLRASPAWAAHGGKDHFLVAGRITWDFRREDQDGPGEWGSRLLVLPEARNMTMLVIESSPWHGNDVGVPYPTYFHPSRAAEVASWQKAVRRARRPWLLAFAGGARASSGNITNVRDVIMDQCARSRRCGLLRCDGAGRRNDCYAPGNVMRLFKKAAFCLQPQGDSYTRRSAFDAMLAGCVPVFFHPGSAYVQYRWHLPADQRAYSVFIPEDGLRNGTIRIEDVLRRFRAKEVAAMREQVVRTIPSIVYRDPRATAVTGGFRDAVDVAIDGVIERVRRIKRGLPPSDEEHEWDAYF